MEEFKKYGVWIAGAIIAAYFIYARFVGNSASSGGSSLAAAGPSDNTVSLAQVYANEDAAMISGRSENYRTLTDYLLGRMSLENNLTLGKLAASNDTLAIQYNYDNAKRALDTQHMAESNYNVNSILAGIAGTFTGASVTNSGPAGTNAMGSSGGLLSMFGGGGGGGGILKGFGG